MMKWITPYLMYIKLALVAALVGGAVWVTWQLAQAGIEDQKREAVDVAVKDMTAQYKQEKAWRTHYQSLADERLSAILTGIANIKVEHRTITNNITKEIERDPVFYGQALPQGGRDEWLKARALVEKAVQGQK